MIDIEGYRKKVIADLFQGKGTKKAWQAWRPRINGLTSNLSNERQIFDLGSQLASVFTSTAIPGRSQAAVKAAGDGWEELVCWYLNAVFCGSRGIATKLKKEFVPSCITDATTINYGSAQTNTESDLVVIVFPEEFQFPSSGKLADLSEAVSSRFSEFEVGVVQCKTSWNENAQIPMLWDMVYRAKGFRDHSVSIGKSGYAIKFLKDFSYSFVTVPTVKKPFHSELMPVKRVRNLTGGNYWGKPSSPSVALSVTEIFNRNFISAFDKPVTESIKDAISVGGGKLPI